VEYFLNNGPVGGLLGMVLVTTVIWSVILAVTFEFARVFKAYDYRTFFKKLLGPFWILFEIIYFILLFIVLAVIGSAAGILLEANFGIPYIFGVVIMLAAVGFLTFKGSGMIENFLSIWSLLLYAVYITFLVVAFIKFGPAIKSSLTSGNIGSGWILGGFKYALYNLGIIAAVLFCLKHIQTRKQALIAGLLGGPIAIIPGLLFYIAVVGFYPEILPVEIPVVYVLNKAGVPALLILFQIVLFGTLVETGTGFIHSVNERLRSALRAKGKDLKQWQRPMVAVIILLIAFGLSTFGLIDLIAKGYGTISWGFFVVFIIPLMTIGIYKIASARRAT
jgi:uncharacterized membrane protein YkvI